MKRIIIASDPGAVFLKDSVKKHLIKRGIEVTDVGSTTDRAIPYYEAGYLVGKAMSKKEHDFGMVFCGTGMGVNLVANKFPGVYCALCDTVYSATLARAITNANVLAMGANFTAPFLANKIADAFLEARFLEDFPEGDPAFLKKAIEIIHGYDKELYR